MAEQPTISPYGLIADTELAAEVLILSYAAGLEFFERYALSAARATQARVSVIADATLVSADPEIVRGAGRTYLDGRAVCPGNTAFHPKLLVIAGTEHATVAVGSGNLTLHGWHHNAELWSVLHASRDNGPIALRGISQFLRGLATAGVRVSHGVAAALERVALRLDALPADEGGVTVVSSVFAPILDQLPTGPVDELWLYAPFFDAQLAAVDRLVDRFEPHELTVCLQPSMTRIDGTNVIALLARHGGSAVAVKEDRYRHGKLVEWRVGEQRFALTGSPNMSGRALLRAVGRGGNCELGLIAAIPESLVPPLGETLHGEQLRAVVYRRIEESPPGLVLLSATTTDEGLRLLLRDPLDEAGRLQVYDAAVWSDRAPVPAAQTDLLIAGGEGGWLTGSAIRMRSAAGETSNEVFIADLSRVLRTSRPSAGRALTDSDQIFKDPKLFEQFLIDAHMLKPHLLPVAGATVPQNGEPPDQPISSAKPQSLEEYLDACASVLGERMLGFALGLPALPSGGPDGLDAFGGGLENGAAEEPDPDSAATMVIPSLSAYTEQRRRRFQRWCVQLAELTPLLVLVGRVLAVRLIARAAAGQLWADREDWTPLLGRAARSLATPGDAYPEERVAAASMGAVTLAILHSQIHRFSQWDPVTTTFTTTAAALAPLLGDVNTDRIAEYGTELAEAFGPALTPEGVRELLDELEHPPDPVDRAVALLATEHDLEARRRGKVVEYTDELQGDPQWKLLLAIGVAERAAPVAAIGRAPRGRVMAVWQPPRVSILHDAPKGIWGTVHRISDHLSPRLHAVTKEQLPTPELTWTVNEPLPATVAAALLGIGLDPKSPFAVQGSPAD